MKQQQILNFKQINTLLTEMKKIAKQAADNITTPIYYYCKVVKIYNDVYADVIYTYGNSSTTFSHMVNKSGVILNIGDLVQLIAPMGDLSDMYIAENQSTDVRTNAERITGILKIGGKNNSSGLIQILNGNSETPSMEISGYSIDFRDFLQTTLPVGSIETNRDDTTPSLNILSELGCSFKIKLRNNDVDKTLYDAIVVNNQLSEGVRNLNINVPLNIYPGDLDSVGAEFTPTGTRLFGNTNFEGGSATNIGDLECVNLNVSGTKNCKQTTNNFGDRLFYSMEYGDNQLGDHGFGNIINGECLISLDPIILESVNTDMNYTVHCDFDEDCHYKFTKTPNYFVINADKDISFSWSMNGSRRGFENERLEYANNLKNDLIQPVERNILVDDLGNDTSDMLNNTLFKD